MLYNAKVGDKLIWKKYRRYGGLIKVLEVTVEKVYKNGSIIVSNLPNRKNRFKSNGMPYGDAYGSVDYAKEDETIESLNAQIEKENAEREQEQKEREERKNAEFKNALENTQNARETIQLIDSTENIDTYKVVVTSERNKRMLGIYKIYPKEYYDFDTNEYVNGFGAGVTYTNSLEDNNWPSCSTIEAKTKEKLIDKILYTLYTSW